MTLLNRAVYIILFLLTNLSFSFGQVAQKNLATRMDSLFDAKASNPFNGAILISMEGKIIYSRANGYSNFATKEKLRLDQQFIIGSISKQITAVLVLLQFEKGSLRLNEPIASYLPELKPSWADTITVHQLLTHTHGITSLNKLLLFKPGTQFSYSQIGYELLASILENVSGKTFRSLCDELFESCNMKNSTTLDSKKDTPMIGYSQTSNGEYKVEKEGLRYPVPAAGVISTAPDLVLWNNKLHSGNLLSDRSYNIMITKQKNARRKHPIFGLTDYGYGITVSDLGKTSQLGLTGLVPGFVSMDFYYPSNRVSVIVLENVAASGDDLHKKFYYHLQVLKLVKDSHLINK